MAYRKIPLVEGELYHIFSKSIAGFKIFQSDRDFERMLDTMKFYTMASTPCRYSWFSELSKKNKYLEEMNANKSKNIVKIIAYCFMPTHIHLILQQLQNNGISKFMNLLLKSYSKYFNCKIKRKGPLWEGRFQNVLVDTDEYFLHLSRYIHLNPVTAFLVDKPEQWIFSSYNEYIGKTKNRNCEFSEYLTLKPESYEKFANDRAGYQRELARIKHLIIE
mgnify:CR=1 FL=1